jgi:dihydrofolate reductase
MNISIIAAVGRHNEIGKNNTLLWDMPADMAHFRTTTRGHTVIMGRKTYESIGKALPGRRNIVVTSDTRYHDTDIEVAHSIHDAFTLAQNDGQIFIIGGAHIYRDSIAYANTLYITHIDGTFDADTFFPEIDTHVWQKVQEEKHKKDTNHAYDYDFVVYKRLQII